MEKITRHNYEAFYLDYLESNLDEKAIVMLFSFLDDNLDLKAELEDDVLDFNLVPNTDSLNQFEKEDLKHFECLKGEICLSNVTDFMVADLENEITTEKKVELDKFVIEHKLEHEKQVMFATKLKSDWSEIYGDTSDLKKRGVIIPFFIKIVSIAAIGLLLFNIIGSNNSEVYNPRYTKFTLNIDSLNHKFKLNFSNKSNSTTIGLVNVKLKNKTVKNLLPLHLPNTVTEVIKKEEPNSHQLVNSIDRTEKLEFILQNQIVNQNPKKITREDIKKIPSISIPKEIPNDEQASVETQNSVKKVDNGIKLIDMYKPITSLTNSYTNLNVSFKKSNPENDYQVTTFKIGKFSYERKRKK